MRRIGRRECALHAVADLLCRSFCAASVIVDDLVQSGGTMQECAKELLRNGAQCVSAYVTHAIFPNQSYRKFFISGDPAAAAANPSVLKHFWVTDSNPKVADLLRDQPPFEVLTIAQNVRDIILDEDETASRDRRC